jgi:hypothetical protein
MPVDCLDASHSLNFAQRRRPRDIADHDGNGLLLTDQDHQVLAAVTSV